MASIVSINKGLDISLAGAPEQRVYPGQSLKTVALLGADYPGIKPQLLVEAGQAVGLGEPIIVDKQDAAVQLTAPATGRVLAVNRGHRRALQSVVIELDETAATEKSFDRVPLNDRIAIREMLLQAGLWPAFRTRPYDRVPKSNSVPGAIFVTAIDTRPLAPDPAVVTAERPEEFITGMEVIAQLGESPLFLCTGPTWSGPTFADTRIKQVEFRGPHPAGLAGTHIHFLSPVNVSRTVWHINYQDVIAIGHLFRSGRLLNERIISIGGPGVMRPRLLRTRPGADIKQLLKGEITPHDACLLVSGSVLDGVTAEEPIAFLGRYHNQVSVLSDKVERRWFGWFGARNCRPSAMLPSEVFERIMPLNILPVPLLRALLVKDSDVAQALGCLELTEEDLALSSFVCPAKQNYGAALRANLELIAKEG